MKILYRQSMSADDPGSTFLHGMGIKHCFFKQLFTEGDAAAITSKRHHHTHYEIHIVESGYSSYEANGKTYILNSGQFLLIPPRIQHRVTLRRPSTSTLSITFLTTEALGLLPAISSCAVGTISSGIQENILRILDEHTHSQHASPQLIAASLAQILILLWRICGAHELVPHSQRSEENSRLALAVQYIGDNIEYAPTVSEVSAYCHLSTKQLTRLFVENKGETPAEYIRTLRAKQLEILLIDSSLSLREISEKMHFSSEYYFNTFFKKYAGITPGEFRTMHIQQAH